MIRFIFHVLPYPEMFTFSCSNTLSTTFFVLCYWRHPSGPEINIINILHLHPGIKASRMVTLGSWSGSSWRNLNGNYRITFSINHHLARKRGAHTIKAHVRRRFRAHRTNKITAYFATWIAQLNRSERGERKKWCGPALLFLHTLSRSFRSNHSACFHRSNCGSTSLHFTCFLINPCPGHGAMLCFHWCRLSSFHTLFPPSQSDLWKQACETALPCRIVKSHKLQFGSTRAFPFYPLSLTDSSKQAHNQCICSGRTSSILSV